MPLRKRRIRAARLHGSPRSQSRSGFFSEWLKTTWEKRRSRSVRRRTVRDSRRQSAACCFAAEELESRLMLTVYTVTSLADNGAAGTLRWAVGQANSNSGNGPNTINLGNLSGTITLGSGAIEFTAGNTTVVGPGSSSLAISGNLASAIFQVDQAATVSLSGVTLENGVGTGKGGAIYNDGTLSLNSVEIDSSQGQFSFDEVDTESAPVQTVGFGGAIYNDVNGQLTVVGSTFDSDQAEEGGAIYNIGGTVSISQTTVNNCDAKQGGGILNTSGGRMTIQDQSLIENNEADSESGGGICNENSSLTIVDSMVEDNFANDDGGGIVNFAGGVLVLNDTLVDSNFGALGGGIYNFTNAALTVENGSVISNNDASDDGGGIFSYQGTVDVSDSTITENYASYGGGVYADSCTMTIENGSSINNNYATGGGLYVYGGTTTISGSELFMNQSPDFGGGALRRWRRFSQSPVDDHLRQHVGRGRRRSARQ